MFIYYKSLFVTSSQILPMLIASWFSHLNREIDKGHLLLKGYQYPKITTFQGADFMIFFKDIPPRIFCDHE